MDIPKRKHLGMLCKRGHNWNNTGKSLRYNRNSCCECMKEYIQIHKSEKREYDKKYRQNNQTTKREKDRIYHQIHNVESKERSKKYYQTHKKEIKEHVKLYQQIHRDERNKWQRIYYKARRKIDPKFKLNKNISIAIYRSLKDNKNGRHWEQLVGWTLDELKIHLERQFRGSMGWINYGEWEIDHRIPISAFNFDCSDHIDFRRCWALSNLQPLWAKENLSKNDKLNKDFQPSLAL